MKRPRTNRLAPALTLAAALCIGGVPGEGAAQQPVVLGDDRGIHVTGTGEVEVQPDQAQLLFAVETAAASAREAAQQNARRMQQVISALTEAGVPREAIDTRNYSVMPEYQHDDRGAPPRIRGYRVMNQVSAETTRLDQVGPLIDAALNAGANRVEGIGFGLQDPEAARAEALREAVQRARAAAETIAQALGVGLGPVLRVSTLADVVRPVPMMARMEAMDAMGAPPPTPIQPGEQTVRAQVVMVFAIGAR